MSDKKNKIIVLDPDKCKGCMRCQLACSFKKEDIFNPAVSRIELIKVYKAGITIPMMCQHCAEPICMYVCPTNAISRNEDTGAIILDENKCVGCRSCYNYCPLGAIKISVKTKKMIKCDLCDGEPACVEACDYGALSYESIDEATEHKRKDGLKKISNVFDNILNR